MSVDPLLSSFRCRQLGGPSLAAREALLLVDIVPAAAALALTPEAWRGQVAAVRDGLGSDAGGRPEGAWSLAQDYARQGGGIALGGLFGALAAVFVEWLGSLAAPRFQVVQEGSESAVLIVPEAPCGVGEVAITIAAALLLEGGITGGDSDTMLGRLRRACDEHALHPFARFLLAEARARDLPMARLAQQEGRFLRLGEGRHQRRFVAAQPAGQGSLAVTLAVRRDVLFSRLGNAGFPLAPFRILTKPDAAEAALAALGPGPYLLRPLARGTGEPPLPLLGAEALPAAAKALVARQRAAVVQRLPAGTPLRLFVFKGRCLAVHVLGEPGGSGSDTAGEPALAPDLARLVEELAQVLELDFMSVDLVSPAPWSGSAGATAPCVIDVDPRPEPAAVLTRRQNRRLAGAFIADAFPAGQGGRVTTVTILGAPPAGLGRGLCRALRHLGRMPGLASGGEASVDGRRLPGPRPPAARLLGDRALDIAIAEVAEQAVRQLGLPFERSTISLLFPPPGAEEEWLAVARLLAGTTRGALVLPAMSDPAPLDPPAGLPLIALGRGTAAAAPATPFWATPSWAVPSWAAASVTREGEAGSLLLHRPAAQSPVLLGVPSPAGDGALPAAIAAVLQGLGLAPLDIARCLVGVGDLLAADEDDGR